MAKDILLPYSPPSGTVMNFDTRTKPIPQGWTIIPWIVTAQKD